MQMLSADVSKGFGEAAAGETEEWVCGQAPAQGRPDAKVVAGAAHDQDAGDAARDQRAYLGDERRDGLLLRRHQRCSVPTGGAACLRFFCMPKVSIQGDTGCLPA